MRIHVCARFRKPSVNLSVGMWLIAEAATRGLAAPDHLDRLLQEQPGPMVGLWRAKHYVFRNHR